MFDLNTRSSFVLLDDTLGGADKANGILFSNPSETLTLSPGASAEQISDFFDQLLARSQQGFFLAGFFAYEIGAYLVNSGLNSNRPESTPLKKEHNSNQRPLPLAQFGVFERKQRLMAEEIEWFLGEVSLVNNKSSRDSSSAVPAVRDLRYEPDFDIYKHSFAVLQEELLAGNTYQTNLTVNCVLEHNLTTIDLYRALRRHNPVAYGGFLRLPTTATTHTPDVLSFSPELFLKKTAERLVCKPIKGTLKRELDEDRDRANIAQLQQDDRFQAENVMIVDLIRNDLSRVAQTGSVNVDLLFGVESFSHLHHLVSEVSATLNLAGFEHRNPLFDIFLALFPCGSITGAPKRNTMQIIDALEQRPRGIYTGSIGYIEPCHDQQVVPDFCFNVAIRTLVESAPQTLTMGVGGGVLHQADVNQEFDEIKLKSAFINGLNRSFDLFETLKVNDGVAVRLDQHLNRLQHSANSFGFDFNRDKIKNTIVEYMQKKTQLDLSANSYVLRLSLSQSGRIDVVDRDFTPPVAQVADLYPRVCFYPEIVSSHNWLRQHKTTARKMYEHAHQYAQQRGCVDALFVNERGVVLEASRWNVWVVNSQGQWQTSPVSEGLLGGVMRAAVLADANLTCLERPIYLADIKQAQRLFVSNSVYGLVQVSMLDDFVFPTVEL